MRIKTRRLILREMGPRDIDDLVEGLNDYEVSKWLALVPFPYTRKDARDWLKQCEKERKAGKARNSYSFGIILKSENKLIGGVGLGSVSKSQGVCDGGIWLNAKYHGKGYGTEALAAAVRFGFTKLKLRRIELGFYKGNRRSYRMQKKVGFRVEGLRRKRYRCRANGKLMDECITGLLKEDWKK